MRTIKRYSNRKLYDTSLSRYTTIQKLASMVQNGENIFVVDNDTNQDLTNIVLKGIVNTTQLSNEQLLTVIRQKNQ